MPIQEETDMKSSTEAKKNREVDASEMYFSIFKRY